MNWEDFFEEIFKTYRYEYDKLSDYEKSLIQRNITFTVPCQIEVLEFTEPALQILVVTSYDGFKDMDLTIHTRVEEPPEQFIKKLADSNEKWKRFGTAQIEQILRSIRGYIIGKGFSWAHLSENASVYVKDDFKTINPSKFAQSRFDEARNQIKMKKRDTELRNTVPIPFALIPKGNGQTIIKFHLPFQLVEEGDYDVTIEGQSAKISIINIPTKETFETISGFQRITSGGGKVQLSDDTRGVSIISYINISMQYFTDERFFLQLGLEYMNRLLDVWRFTTGRFWLKDGVSDRDIVKMDWERISGSGVKTKGIFAFGIPGNIKISTKIIETKDALPKIFKYLVDETRVPLFSILRLNALNHYTERKYGLAILEMNIALEDYARGYLANKLLTKGLSNDDVNRKFKTYDENFHKMMTKGFKEITGHSLEDNPMLWKGFNRMRTKRKNAIHPILKKSSFEDATEVIKTATYIAEWISNQ